MRVRVKVEVTGHCQSRGLEGLGLGVGYDLSPSSNRRTKQDFTGAPNAVRTSNPYPHPHRYTHPYTST